EVHQNRLRIGAIGPQFVFIRMTRTVHAQDGIKCAVLKPANKQFAESRIGGIAENESTNVGCPIGNSRECEIQTGGNLSPKTKPIRIDVARPGRNSISLRSGEGGTS